VSVFEKEFGLKYLLAFPAALVALAAALLSMPWLVLSIGLSVLGMDDDADRVMDASPMVRLFDWTERR